MIPANLLPLLWKHRRWIAYAALLAGLAISVLWWRANLIAHGRALGEASVQAKWDKAKEDAKQARIDLYETEITDYKARLTQQEADTAALASTLTEQQALAERLQNALSRARMVAHVPNPDSACPVVRLSPAFRVCVNASATGSSGAVAACETLGMPVSPAP